jgi:hypothetical protein
MASYEIIVYAPGAPSRTVHLGTSEADMHSHLNAVEGTLQATSANADIEIRKGRRSRWIFYRGGAPTEVARFTPEAIA